MKVQGEFKMQANNTNGVVIDIAAFKVSHSVDIDASALPVARARSVSIGALDATPWTVQRASAHRDTTLCGFN